jgi:hypothetical protein
VKLTTHLHLVPRLRIGGAVPVFPLYAFITWTRTTLPFCPKIFMRSVFAANLFRLVLTMAVPFLGKN